MITAKDIEIKSYYRKETRATEVQADVLLRAVGTVRDPDIYEGAMSVEWMEMRLKEEILHKLYSDIRAKLRDGRYDVKFWIRDQADPYFSKMQAADMIDRVFKDTLDLIDEKMKVD
jgi:hypothetical protein